MLLNKAWDTERGGHGCRGAPVSFSAGLQAVSPSSCLGLGLAQHRDISACVRAASSDLASWRVTKSLASPGSCSASPERLAAALLRNGKTPSTSREELRFPEKLREERLPSPEWAG